MDLLGFPLQESEFLAVDCETNGRAGEACELTEVAAVLVGGGELHDEFTSLVAVEQPLDRGIQRFTGISAAMLDDAPQPASVLPELLERLEGRVLVAHNAAFDRRVLRHACRRAGLQWPEVPVLCTLSVARRLLPLQRQRALGPLADALGVEVEGQHRALPDARTCARVLCALLPRLCAHAHTVGDAVTLLAGARRRARPARRRPARAGSGLPARHGVPVELDFAALPRDPGVYIFRDAAGAPLYVGKSVSIRSRARAHFAPSAADASWRAHAEIIDYRTTASELGALVLENRLIKEMAPPGNQRLNGHEDRAVYLRCRLDIAFPVLELARDPAPGHAINVGPLRGRRAAGELVEQLNSLFGLRHCGRRLPRRQHPSAYGQMGRCLSPCLGDLDPNLYRRRLDAALGLFAAGGDGRERLLGLVRAQMGAASAERHYERAASLRRRLRRLDTLLSRLEGVLCALHARALLALVSHPSRPECREAFWIVGGRLVDSGTVPPTAELDAAVLSDLYARSARHRLAAGGGGPTSLSAFVAPGEVDEVRILGSWLAAHPETPVLMLDEGLELDALRGFLAAPAPARPPLRLAADVPAHSPEIGCTSA